jgi:hypothetical protein
MSVEDARRASEAKRDLEGFLRCRLMLGPVLVGSGSLIARVLDAKAGTSYHDRFHLDDRSSQYGP